MTPTQSSQEQTLFGHPTGLFTLFFAEMWERFSYYGMRALLVFYMIKGFLGFNDNQAYAVYGAYTALVYATPFIGGMLADRLLGSRLAVVIGGLLMAAGHLLMTVENEMAFFSALALLIVGNGFFKPNISTIVGGLYKRPEKKDAGFTIFYMGINLGAAMSPILCGYVGETYGWHYGFGLATIGMLIGVAVFVAPTRLTQLLILIGAVGSSVAMLFLQDTWLQLAVRVVLGLALTLAGLVAFRALAKGGLPKDVGGVPDPALLNKKLLGFLPTTWAVFLGVAIAVPGLALIVQQHDIATWALSITGAAAIGYLLFEAVRSTVVERHRLFVVLILMFFSMLFWAFFEQAGSSVNLFTDRNVDRVFEKRKAVAGDVGKLIKFRIPIKTEDKELANLPLLTQEQLGYQVGGGTFTITDLQNLRDTARKAEFVESYVPKGAWSLLDELLDRPASYYYKATMAPVRAWYKRYKRQFQVAGYLPQAAWDVSRSAPVRRPLLHVSKLTVLEWRISKAQIGMGLDGAEIPASEFQGVNPLFILIFGLVFSAIWGFLATRGREPSTPTKFALGVLQLGLGFGAFWYGAKSADPRGMVALSWLLLGYLLQTTGELCLSPVGLSMVTKLSPKKLVSTVMGAWFLATAFSNLLAGIIATFTGISHGGDGPSVIPAPKETVMIYGDVFGTIAVAALISAGVCFLLVPLLSKWMHTDVTD